MAEELEDKYSRFQRNTGIDLQAEIAESGGITDLSDTPRFLLYNAGWPSRGTSPRATFFIGGNPDTDAPQDINLAAGDLWVPFGGEMI